MTIDLGAGPLVFSDVIDRAAAGIYDAVAAAQGFAWYVGADGELRANERYLHAPLVEECSAVEWSGPAPGPLYKAFRDDPKGFSWLSDGDAFPDVAPLVWEAGRGDGYEPGVNRRPVHGCHAGETMGTLGNHVELDTARLARR